MIRLHGGSEGRLAVRLVTVEYGAILALVYQDGLLIDTLREHSYPEAFQAVRRAYPTSIVFTRHGPLEGAKPIGRISRDALERYLNQIVLGNTTSLDRVVAEIFREIQTDRICGKIKPFVEGEQIGTLPRCRRADLTGVKSHIGPMPRNARHN